LISDLNGDDFSQDNGCIIDLSAFGDCLSHFQRFVVKGRLVRLELAVVFDLSDEIHGLLHQIDAFH